MKFIIEHLENELYEWCFIEYKNISKFVGKKNLLITNVKNNNDIIKLKKFAGIISDSVLKLNLKNACLLDAKSDKSLNPKDAEKFDYFIFGGILGDFPERHRTEKYLTNKLKNVSVRNLSDKQMPTDTAVIVTKLICDGNSIDKLKFRDTLVIDIKKGKFNETVELPFRYVVLNDQPIISKDLVNYLKKKKDI